VSARGAGFAEGAASASGGESTMRILQLRTLSGPNLFATFPVLRMTLDLEDLVETASDSVPGFVERLTALLPGLGTHRCSRGYEGGFVERLREGTYPGHIVEHVALELSGPAGIEASYGKTVYAGSHGQYHVVVEFENEAAMTAILRASVGIVSTLLRGGEVPAAEIERIVAEAKEIVSDTALGPSTRAVVDAARRRGIPWTRLNDQSLVVLGYGKYRKFIQATTTSQTSYVATDVASDKQLTKDLLERAGVPVPRGVVVREEAEAVAALAELGAPVIVKPLDGNQGKGVSLDLRTEEDVRRAFHIAKEYRSRVLVEEMVAGKNYRVLVVGGKLVAASERMPAHVIGDGDHTIEELVAIENENPMRAPGHTGALSMIEIDDVVLGELARHGRSLSDVPRDGEIVLLRESANLSTGGTAGDVTDQVHPMTARMCERAARAIDLDVCGIDLVMRDISEPLSDCGAVIELNAAPGIRMHVHPSSGKPRDVGAAIIASMYPEGAPSRIPIVAITGTNGKTTTTRMIGHVLEDGGNVVGMTTTDGVAIGGVCVQKGDTTGPASARMVLFDPTVDVAVLETARGGIVRRGLGYDWSDVGVVTNIAADHLGQDGIETIDDLVRVKSLVPERVRAGGTLVLNADDERVLAMATLPAVTKTPKQIVLFSTAAENEAFDAHVRSGGRGYTTRGAWVVEVTGDREERILPVVDMPASFAGTATFQIANGLACIAACRALGMDVASVARALRRFDNATQNPGRMNVFQLASGYAIVDYGHNPASIDAITTMVARWEHRRVTGVLSLPGDRTHGLLETAVRVAIHGLDRIIIKEDQDKRGRQAGEIAAEILDVVAKEAPAVARTVIVDEIAAVRHALDTMEPGEVVVIFTDAIDEVTRMLTDRGGIAVADPPVDGPHSRPAGRLAG